MADHVRKQIRDAAVAALTGLITTTTHVFASRVRDLQDDELPALRVFVGDEASRRESTGGHSTAYLERMAQLHVEGVCKAVLDADLDDTFDAIAKEVEIALKDGLAPAKMVTLTSTEIEFDGDGEKARAIIRLSFNVLYYTTVGAPDVAQ